MCVRLPHASLYDSHTAHGVYPSCQFRGASAHRPAILQPDAHHVHGRRLHAAHHSATPPFERVHHFAAPWRGRTCTCYHSSQNMVPTTMGLYTPCPDVPELQPTLLAPKQHLVQVGTGVHEGRYLERVRVELNLLEVICWAWTRASMRIAGGVILTQ